MKILAMLLIAAALSSCTTRTLRLPNGVEYTSTSFLTNPSIGPVRVAGEKDKIDFTMGSYNHNQTELAKLLLQVAALSATQ